MLLPRPPFFLPTADSSAALRSSALDARAGSPALPFHWLIELDGVAERSGGRFFTVADPVLNVFCEDGHLPKCRLRIGTAEVERIRQESDQRYREDQTHLSLCLDQLSNGG